MESYKYNHQRAMLVLTVWDQIMILRESLLNQFACRKTL